MLSENIVSKTLNMVSMLAIMGAVLGSVLTTASWGMDQGRIGDEIGWGPVNLGVTSKSARSVQDLQTICEHKKYSNVKETVGTLWIQVSSGEMDQVPVSFKSIFQTYPDLTELYVKKMTLGYKPLGDSRIKDLASNLPASLKKLSLLHCNVSDEGATLLANFLHNNSTLTELALELNGIGDTGTQELAKLLTVNKTIKVLKLMGNKMTDKGAFSLVRPLYEPTNTLKELDIAANKGIVGLTGAKANEIAGVLKAKGVIVSF